MSRMASVSDRWWVRSLLGADRGAWALVRVAEAVRDEVLRARLSVAEQEALTLECYARSTTYGPGGSAFEAGLFPWEELALAHPRWLACSCTDHADASFRARTHLGNVMLERLCRRRRQIG